MKLDLNAILCLIVAMFGLVACGQSPETKITVSAASNLIPAFEEIGQRFEAETGIAVIYNFASSGTLAQQIEQGAPVDVFASADTAYVTGLAEKGHIKPATVQPYARGRLVMWRGPGKLVPESPQDLLKPDIQRVAIPNPNYAPYGIIAREVLLNAGVLEQVQGKLVLADNVRQTLTYAETGDVDVALVPLSLVINLKQGCYVLIPATAHSPLVQSLGLTSQSQQSAQARQFVDFVLSQRGQAILQQYGYESVK